MHPRQASLLTQATEIAERTAVEKEGAQTFLWKYTDPEGNIFYLDKKVRPIKSPFTGKPFTTLPVRFTPAQVGKALKEDSGEEADKE